MTQCRQLMWYSCFFALYSMNPIFLKISVQNYKPGLAFGRNEIFNIYLKSKFLVIETKYFLAVHFTSIKSEQQYYHSVIKFSKFNPCSRGDLDPALPTAGADICPAHRERPQVRRAFESDPTFVLTVQTAPTTAGRQSVLPLPNSLPSVSRTRSNNV